MYFISPDKQAGNQFSKESHIQYLQGNGETVFVIDTDGSMRSFLREILTINGYRVLTAESSKQARSIYRNNIDRIDLIMMDMRTENKEKFISYVVRSELRPVILYTDEPLPGAKQRTIKGFTVVEKPFDIYELFNLIKLKTEGLNLV